MVENRTVKKVQDFLGIKMPSHICEWLEDRQIVKGFTQEQIMEAIDFTPPFLKIERMVILGMDDDSIIQSKGISIGKMTQQDTEGHYNNTVFLAYCGRLMGQAASSHLGVLFPDTAPQVVKVDRIRPIRSSGNIIWKPNKEGSIFIIETIIIKKKLQVIIVDSRVSFGDLVFGIANNATIVLTPKESIYTAKELPIN